VDSKRKRQLKALGKAEVARESATLHAPLRAANPAAPGDNAWAENYRRGVQRERWLRRKLPLLHARRLNQLFVIHPWGANTWSAHVGGYLLCTICNSAAPSMMPRRLLYWRSCECGNIGWRCIFGRSWHVVKDPSQLTPVKLIGKG
jgi:hypothetical protein